MKVAVVTQYFPTSSEPWAGHSAYQTLRLLARRCELRVFYPEARYPRYLAPAGRRPASDRSWRPDGVDVTYIPYLAIPGVSRPLNGFSMARALLEEVRRFEPDVILNYVVYPDGYAATRIGQKLKIAVVLTAIGSDLNRISDPLCGALTRSALRRADGVITVSGDLARTAIRLGGKAETTRAILNGCDTEVFHVRERTAARETLGIERAGQIVAYIGRLDVRKGLMELIEAMAMLQRSRAGTRCYLVGDGPAKPLLVETVRQHKAEEAITLVPACPTEQVARWMAAADVVTLPSYAEGCPNVVVEALNSGRPVVATEVGGIPELMDDRSGRLVPPKDVAALAGALGEALDATWDAEDIAARNSRGWGDVAAEVNEELRRVVEA